MRQIIINDLDFTHIPASVIGRTGEGDRGEGSPSTGDNVATRGLAWRVIRSQRERERERES